MGKMKAWLMDMEEDAIRMSANEFRVQHGEEHIYIWETANGPEFQSTPTEHDRKTLLEQIKKMFKREYHSSLHKLNYYDVARIYSATKKVGV
jgi:carboxylesterase type B|tara:strand:+ start:790 stop:1065 length:276 start_codon:yes stop_codon:yes gene_type:complete